MFIARPAISSENKMYLRKRGFEIYHGKPLREGEVLAKGKPFRGDEGPYVFLTKKGSITSGGESIRLVSFRLSGTMSVNDHPTDKDVTVYDIATLIETAASGGGNSRANPYRFPEGSPIKIFVDDPTYQPALEELANRGYSVKDL